MWMLRGVRGATTVKANDAESIIDATEELLKSMIETNGILQEHVASVLFTTTPDLDATYPAVAARRVGWTSTALMGFQEMQVPGGLPYCIRVLIHWNTPKSQQEIVHIYLNAAKSLRPDLSQEQNHLQALHQPSATTRRREIKP